MSEHKPSSFDSVSFTNRPPILPREYRVITPNNLYSGQIVHPLAKGVIAMHPDSMIGIIDGSAELVGAHKPTIYLGRFGLMHVYTEGLDTYIADIRSLTIEGIRNHPQDTLSSIYDRDTPKSFADPKELMGLIHFNEEGGCAYTGSKKLYDAAIHLMLVVDAVKNHQPIPDVHETIVQTAEQTVTPHSTDVIDSTEPQSKQ